jgi:uncharacterized surface protein with fasciclin (FAS1) repeats
MIRKQRLAMGLLFPLALFALRIEVLSAQVPDILATAVATGTFQILLEAWTATGMVDDLSGPGPFTVFAPTDSAFESLPEGLLECLLRPENVGTLTNILSYHIVSGFSILSGKLVSGLRLEMLNGGRILIDDANGLVINGVAVIRVPDIVADNGVIHSIDSGMSLPYLSSERIPFSATSTNNTPLQF